MGVADSTAATGSCSWQKMRAERAVEWSDVAETNPRDVWLVGYRWLDKSEVDWRGVIEHWDGRRWHTDLLPLGSHPAGVAGVSATNAWRVTEDRDDRARIAHWDGRRWSVVGAFSNWPGVSDITALPSGEAWIVGYEGLIVHWNGRRWQRMTSPRDHGSAVGYEHVVARSTKDVWALGSRESNRGWRTVAAHWDGRSWRFVPTPDLANELGGRLEDVGETFSHGQIGDDGALYAIAHTGGQRWVIEQRAGNHWNRVSLPFRRGPEYVMVGSFVVRTLTDVLAAHDPDIGVGRLPRLYHWNGRAWSTVKVPTALRSAHEFRITPVGRTTWALGNNGGKGKDRLGVAMRRRCDS
ncbi:MAG: hypothetical protein ACXVFD_09345 [Gaiellaceae bacterium]